MKKVMAAVLAGACLLSAGSFFSTAAFAQDTTSTAKSKAKPAAKATTKAKTEKKRIIHRRVTRKAATVGAAAAVPLLAGAEKWSCQDNLSLQIAGDMKRDQILTVQWEGRNYKLPRVVTTTGADRFYDPASGMDLVVIPVKAMLFNDRGDRTRLADECKTQLMAEQNAPAPTQSNALIRGNK